MHTKNPSIKSRVAEAYGTSERQLQRWIDAKAPVLVASRMRAHLIAQNNYGATGSRLQDDAEQKRIQKELDAIFGEDLEASDAVFGQLMRVFRAVDEAADQVKLSRLSQKPELTKMIKAVQRSMKPLEDVSFHGVVFND